MKKTLLPAQSQFTPDFIGTKFISIAIGTFLIFNFSLLIGGSAQSIPINIGTQNPSMPVGGYTICGTMENLEMLKQQDPRLEARMAAIEEQTQEYIKNNPQKTQGVVVKIPTVVHVVYANATQNISDTYIKQQIDVLNKDFRKLNADWNQTPSVWTSLVADCEIEFCLATKDPSGAATTGIKHTSTTVASFSPTTDKVKYTAQGGDDIWNRDKYFNLWVCNLGSSGLLGYALFPGVAAAIDGVVIDYRSLPGPPTYAPPYDLGRVATHEIGHWFNLKHINGNTTCGDDLVTDTPTQDKLHQSATSGSTGPPTGCFTVPYHVNACSGSTNGEMTMNYMDYTDNKCMFMFTAGQKARMLAALNGTRAGLLTSAAANCAGVTGIYELSLSDHIAIYPNPSTGEVSIATLSTINSMDLKVYNAIGEVVVTKKINVPASGETKINLSSNPDGIYLFQVKTSEGTITKKIVINR